jgi:hypothetical protein
MASTYTPLGVELQATGENAGTWGTKTNTNLQIIEQISGGYTTQSIAGGAQTTALSVSDGSTGATLSHRMIEFTGTITGNQSLFFSVDGGDNTAAIKIAGKETIWVPSSAMYPNTTNGCADLEQTELSNGPELKSLDFDKDSDEFAQFAVAFPKSWNEGTVTFQAYFTADSTNTGTVSWALNGVSCADNDTINVAFGTAVAPTAKAHSGTANDLDVTAESGAVTIAGSPSTDEQVFFQIQ